MAHTSIRFGFRCFTTEGVVGGGVAGWRGPVGRVPGKGGCGRLTRAGRGRGGRGPGGQAPGPRPVGGKALPRLMHQRGANGAGVAVRCRGGRAQPVYPGRAWLWPGQTPSGAGRVGPG